MFTRREFLAHGARLAALLGLGSGAAPQIAGALADLSTGSAPVLWLQGMSCSGCSVSLLNGETPSPARLLTRYLSLRFHPTLSAATGRVATTVVEDTVRQGGYWLVVEGSIPAAMPEACRVAGEPVGRLVSRAARNARGVLAAGTCAAFGGIPAAEGNPAGACAVSTFLEQEGVSTPVVNLPGCPMHPEWMVATVVHALRFGLPPLDEKRRPLPLYERLVHDQCPRFADYEREAFARTFSEPGCLFHLGCQGPLTHGDCNVRLWNSGTNTCINAGAPCVGCASEEFALRASFPFYLKNTSQS